MLAIENLTAGYGQSVVLHGVSLEAPTGEITCLMGRNGVGKTTLLKCIIGLIHSRSGQVSIGERDLSASPTHQRARAGIGYVPQGRAVFPQLTVLENLLMGLETRRSDPGMLEEIYQMFPVLSDMGQRKAGALSGGQQQQLAIGRALAGRPRVLLLDEPTEGIQPSIIWQIERTISDLRDRGDLSILLVEQFVEFAVGLSDRYYVMEKGTMVAEGNSKELTDQTVREFLAV